MRGDLLLLFDHHFDDYSHFSRHRHPQRHLVSSGLAAKVWYHTLFFRALLHKYLIGMAGKVM